MDLLSFITASVTLPVGIHSRSTGAGSLYSELVPLEPENVSDLHADDDGLSGVVKDFLSDLERRRPPRGPILNIPTQTVETCDLASHNSIVPVEEGDNPKAPAVDIVNGLDNIDVAEQSRHSQPPAEDMGAPLGFTLTACPWVNENNVVDYTQLRIGSTDVFSQPSAEMTAPPAVPGEIAGGNQAPMVEGAPAMLHREDIVVNRSRSSSVRSTNSQNAARRVHKNNAGRQTLYLVTLDGLIDGWEDHLFSVPVGPAWITGEQVRQLCSRNTNAELGLPGVQVVKLVPPGMYSCQSHGSGWFLVHGQEEKNTLTVMVQPSTTVITLPGFRYRDKNDNVVVVADKRYRVYDSLFTRLNKNFRGAQVTEALLNAIVANSVDNTVNHSILQETQAYYVAMMTKRYYAQINNTTNNTTIQTNANALAKGDRGMLDLVDVSASLIDHKMPWQIMDTECNLPLDWPIRDDFEVVSSNAVDFLTTGPNEHEPSVVPGNKYNEQKVDLKKKLYPRFRSLKTKPRHRTAYFKLSGLNMPDFEEYSNSANNLTHGLKRLLGAKPNEVSQRLNSIMLGAHIAREIGGAFNHIHAKDVFHMLEAGRLKKTPREKAVVEHILHAPLLDPAYVDQTRVFIAQSFAQVWRECTRSKITVIMDALKTAGRWTFNSIYKGLLTNCACLFSREQLTQIAHVKRKLRQKYVMGALLSDEDDLLVRQLNVKIKRELAKFGKAPRCFVAYDAGCVYANELPEFCKVGIDGKHFFNIGDYTLVLNIMAKPRPDSLEEIFTDLHQAMGTENHIFAAIYSDDMVIAGRIGGKSFCFNLDISSNDSSQDVAAFLGAFACMGNFQPTRALNLIRQCLLPLTVASPEDPSSFLSFKFKGPFEGSGSVLTTLLNHLGSLMIVLAFFFLVVQEAMKGVVMTDDVINACARLGAEYVGHTVTLDQCVVGGDIDFYHVQFLKRSPFFHGGKWRPYTNLGCILRSLGTVEDDLTCDQLGLTNTQFWALTNEQRISLFCNGIVKGWKHEPSNPVIRALRERFGDNHPTIKQCREITGTPAMGEIKHDSLVYIFDEVKDESLFDNTDAIRQRYGCTDEDIAELARQIISLEVGHEARSHMFTRIMEVDYGVVV